MGSLGRYKSFILSHLLAAKNNDGSAQVDGVARRRRAARERPGDAHFDNVFTASLQSRGVNMSAE